MTPLGDRPDHLRTDGDWLARHVAGMVALVLGVVAFIVVAVTQDRLWATPDPRISVPAFALTALAAAALVLGWFVMLAVIVAATVVLILILHSVM